MDITIEKKLKALWAVQQIDSKRDQLSALRGELPMEVSDLEDEITGLNTRLERNQSEIENLNDQIAGYKNKIKQSEQYIAKFKLQLNEVKNNREFEALTKEIEIMELEIQATEKRIGEAGYQAERLNETLEVTKTEIEDRNKYLEQKKDELVNIVKETEEEESKLDEERSKAEKMVEERLMKAYNRIRENAKNGIAIAPIMRSSCGGCFAKVPPQRQADIRQHVKIIDCEHCGRLLVDATITGIQSEIETDDDKPKRRVRKRLGTAS